MPSFVRSNFSDLPRLLLPVSCKFACWRHLREKELTLVFVQLLSSLSVEAALRRHLAGQTFQASHCKRPSRGQSLSFAFLSVLHGWCLPSARKSGSKPGSAMICKRHQGSYHQVDRHLFMATAGVYLSNNNSCANPSVLCGFTLQKG